MIGGVDLEMKGTCFLRKSLMLKIILFLVTFILGASAAWLFLRNRSVVDFHEKALFQVAEEGQTQFNQTEVSEPESPVVQSMPVVFPMNGKVTIEAIEEVGKFPQMLFVGANKDVLHRCAIEDKEKWLIPEKDSILTQPELRFNVLHSDGFKSPIIMSVAVAHGGSDDAFYLTLFGEVDGKIRRLNQEPIFANIQGGYYLGYLNDKFGYGLAVWNFVWDNGAHYDLHNYEIELYRLENGKLKRVLRKISKKAYDSDEGSRSLQELGINVRDQREDIPRINEFIGANS